LLVTRGGWRAGGDCFSAGCHAGGLRVSREGVCNSALDAELVPSDVDRGQIGAWGIKGQGWGCEAR
jgi:hypothetical protein